MVGGILFIADVTPLNQLAGVAGTFLAVSGLALIFFVSAISLGAIAASLAVLQRDWVVAAAGAARFHPFRALLLGAINVVGAVVLTTALVRAGWPGLIGFAILIGLAYLALVGLSGLAWLIGASVFGEESLSPQPLPALAGGIILGAGFAFPILGQVLAVISLFCAVGCAIGTVLQRD